MVLGDNCGHFNYYRICCGGDKSNEKVNTSSTYSSSQTDPQEIDKDDHEDENQSSSETETTIPVVPGSNAYDITVFKNKGLPEADRSNSSDGYTFSATNEQYSYTINTDKIMHLVLLNITCLEMITGF